MRFLKNVKRKASLALAALLILAAASTSMGMYVHDRAGIFSDSEEEELRALAREYSEKLNVHFVIMTANDGTVRNFERHIRSFYHRNIAGVGGIFESAMFSVNMAARKVDNDFFGELRTMVSDAEANVIGEGFEGYMRAGNYMAAARYFLHETARLVERKLALYNIDVPEVNPDDFVYDFSGTLSDEERLGLAAELRAVSSNMGVGNIVVIIEQAASEEYLRRFASSFYRRNFRPLNLFDGFFILAVSAGSGIVIDRAAVASPFGSYQPINNDIRDTERNVRSDIRTHSLYTGILNFSAVQARRWQMRDHDVSHLDYDRRIHDFAGVLTEEQEERLRNAIIEEYGRHRRAVDFQIILSDFSAPDTLMQFGRAFRRDFSNYEDSFVYLLIGAPSEQEGSSRYIVANYFGRRAASKISDGRLRRIESRIEEILESGDYYAACGAFIESMSEGLSSLIPYVRMVPGLGRALFLSVLAAVVLSLVKLFFIRADHDDGMKDKVSGSSYLVGGSLQLNYVSDVFLHTHTSRHLKPDSRSDSDSGGSSGSSTSSRSSRGF